MEDSGGTISEFCSCEDIHFEKAIGVPYAEIYIRNIHIQPLGDGVLRPKIVEHPLHGAVWESLERHGFEREVVLLLNDNEYCYYCTVEKDNKIYLFPSDNCDKELPDNEIFLEKKVNIRLPW